MSRAHGVLGIFRGGFRGMGCDPCINLKPRAPVHKQLSSNNRKFISEPARGADRQSRLQHLPMTVSGLGFGR